MISSISCDLFQMSVTEQACYTLISTPDSDYPSQDQLRKELEIGDIKAKTEALKKVIYIILNGEKIPGILMAVVKFVLPLQDHNIKKLLLIFWEIIPKTSPDGKLLHEMILVCDAYRRDLQHPNEFIRGSTLRFLCKLKVSHHFLTSFSDNLRFLELFLMIRNRRFWNH